MSEPIASVQTPPLLSLIEIAGDAEHVAEVQKFFGDVRCWPVVNRDALKFRVTAKLPNFYRDSFADRVGASLYILVPNQELVAVWPSEGCEDVRYGTAHHQGKVITSGISMHRGLTGLYVCLSPAGHRISDSGSLGI